MGDVDLVHRNAANDVNGLVRDYGQELLLGHNIVDIWIE